jgi:hypothetical protein
MAQHISAKLIEADDVKRKVPKPVQQAVELRLITDRGYDTGPAPV